MGYFLLPINGPDFVDGVVDSRAEPTMHAEDRVINDGSQREVVENISAVPPDVEGTVFSEALVIEAVNLSDLSAFVVSPYECNHIGISDFVGEEKQKSFHAIEPSVHEIS